jgi:serine/threonine-protein kinase
MSELTGKAIGPYRILERLGRGGMADVYKARHERLDVFRAIKFVRAEFVDAAEFRVRFQKEAQAVAQLRHPNIVQVHDFGETDGAYYMVMEFVEGRGLDHVIAAEGEVRPIARAVGIARQVAAALDYAHGLGLIHRDIKPQNVMLTPAGQVVLMDFGIARLTQDAGTRLTRTGMGIGTPAYMAPEQALGERDIGPAADIYALSILLFELLTGRVPFDAETPVSLLLRALREPLTPPRSLSSDIGEGLQAVVMKGAAKPPEDRYSSAAALDAALAAALERDLQAAARVPDRPPAPSPSSPTRSGAVIAAVAAGSIAGIAAVYGGWTLRARPPAPVASPAAVATVAPSAEAPALDARPVEQEAAAPAAPAPAPAPSPTRTTPETPSVPARDAVAPIRDPPADFPVAADAPGVAAAPRPPLRGPQRIVRGVTTQAEILRRFGTPGVTTRDRKGREVWIYHREAPPAQVAPAGGTRMRAAGIDASGTSGTALMMFTVTFATDRTVLDFQARRPAN